MSCTHDPMDAAQYYFRVSSRRMRDKEVQVISWALSDSNSIRCPSPRLDPSRTVFVGGLHGLINAGECVCVCIRVSFLLCILFLLLTLPELPLTAFNVIVVVVLSPEIFQVLFWGYL